MIRKCLAASVLFLALPLLGTEGYTAYKMVSPPCLDGKGDAPGWKNVPWAYGFRNLNEQFSFSLKQTAFKIAYDNDFLYLLTRCCEPEMAKVKTGERAFEGWPPNIDDIYFIYSNSYDSQGSYESQQYKIIQLGAGGIHRILDPKGELPTPPDWRTAYRANDRNWFLETAIPLKLLELDPANGGFFNVVRHLKTVPGSFEQRTSSWNLATNAKLSQHTLSPLRFSPNGAVANVAAAEAKLASTGPAHYAWWLAGKLGKIKDQGGDYAAAKARLVNSPNWPLADQIRHNIEAVTRTQPGAPGPMTDAYLAWQFVLAQMAETSAPIRLTLATRDATAQVFLNGQELKPEGGVLKFLLGGDDIYQLNLADGANAIAVAAKATGPNPGLAIKLPDFPETDGRWAADTNPAEGWQSIDFDDLAWTLPLQDGQWLWPAPEAKDASFRQLLLWSRNFHGGKLSAIVPPHTEYGFSPNTVEVLQQALFAPTNRPMRSYACQLELPTGFRLLDSKGKRNRPDSWGASEVAVREIKVDGQPYLQYTLKYDVSALQDAYSSMLPVKESGYAQPRGNAVFRFRRLINHNITELTTGLNVRMLPPVNGRRMETILYPQYDFSHGLSDEVMVELVRQGVAAGMDVYYCPPSAKGSISADNQLLRDNGGKLVISCNMPLWGLDGKSEVYNLAKGNPKYAAVYFNNSGPFLTYPGCAIDFCPTYALGEGRQAFAAALLKDYRRMKSSVPGATALFLDNERYAWKLEGKNTKPGEHCACFCDHCKEAFRQFAGLPMAKPLSDQEIYGQHRAAWEKFWINNQANRLMALVKETANAAGIETIFYHNSHDRDTWRAVAGNSNRYAVGIPGCASHYAGRERQAELDSWAAFYGSHGIARFLGQRSTYFPWRAGRDGRFRMVGSKDGWSLNPRQLKWELVRMAATTHGGVVYEGVIQLTGGSLYHFGEATRLIATYERLFHDGKRDDSLADAGDYKYPDILVLTKGDERLVLVFNEAKEPKTLKLNNHKLKPGQRAEIFERPGKIADPASIEVTVPAEDVVAIHID